MASTELMSFDERRSCRNYSDTDLISGEKINRTSTDKLVKLSDGYCYVRKGVKTWILYLINSQGLTLGDENFRLPTRVSITEDDLRKLRIDIPEPVDVEVESDSYGPLNVWNINRNSMYNPGGRYSRYNRDGTERGYESDASEDSVMLGNFRGMYENVFNEEAPEEYSIGDITRLLEERRVMEMDGRIRWRSRKMRRSRRASRKRSRKMRRSIRRSRRASRTKRRRLRRASMKRSIKMRKSIRKSRRRSRRKSRRESRRKKRRETRRRSRRASRKSRR